MNIGIDIDDTIMDTFDHVMPCVAEYFNASLEDLKKRNISYPNLPKEWKEKEIEFSKKYYDNVVPSTPIKPDASKYLKKIKQLGHTIIIISARDNRLYTDAYKTTYEQLKSNNVVYDKLFCTFDKAEKCKEEKVDLFIDDSIDNCKKINGMGIPVLLFNSKCNANIDTNFKRVTSWKQVYQLIKEMKK